MKIKKWKAGRLDKAGVVQVKLRKLGNGVILVAVDSFGQDLTSCNNILSLNKDGVELRSCYDGGGIKITSSGKAALV